MRTNQNPRLATLIVILEVIITFFIGITGNKIAEYIQISPIIVGVFAVICLLILAILSYIKTHDFSAPAIKDFQFGATVSKYIPKSVIGIFPFGLIVGLIVGLLLIWIFQGTYYDIPFTGDLWVYRYDFWGVFFGVALCLIFALIFDGPLASGIAIGYGTSFATGASLFTPYLAPYYLIGYIIGFSLFAVLLFRAESLLSKIRKTISEPRI